MSKTFIVVTTKGGDGKTVTATMGIPSLFLGEKKEIRIYMIDNNNSQDFLNSSLKFEALKVDESRKNLVGVAFDALKSTISGEQDNIINIIDAGGGDDTLEVLELIKSIKIDNATYVVPVSHDIQYTQNAIDTIEKIREIEQNPKIFLLLNKCRTLDIEDIEKQFIGIFGSKKHTLSDRRKEDVLKDVKFVYLQESEAFSVVAGLHKQTLYDIYPKAKEIAENYDELRVKWASEAASLEEYQEKIDFKEFAEDIVSLFTKVSLSLAPLKGE